MLITMYETGSKFKNVTAFILYSTVTYTVFFIFCLPCIMYVYANVYVNVSV